MILARQAGRQGSLPGNFIVLRTKWLIFKLYTKQALGSNLNRISNLMLFKDSIRLKNMYMILKKIFLNELLSLF